jgi:transcriptional regulator with XRE-family HTH domain
MGTLGRYLREAREARGIDLRDAAQQTRISLQYLKALEMEDFTKLPGAVFVRGFLKNYCKFLRLDEAEVMKKFAEIQQVPSPAIPVTNAPPVEEKEEVQDPSKKIPLEPFIWGAAIVIVLVLALFSALPQKTTKEMHQDAMPMATGLTGTATVPSAPSQPEKLYLEVVAREDTWLLVRTDSSPQKKAVLKKGESLIWSADERFLLSYGGAGALTLLLNGKELTLSEPKNTVVRDLTIIASGIVNRKIQAESPRPRRKQQPPVEHPSAPTVSEPARNAQPTSPPAPPKLQIQITPQEPQATPEPKPEPAPAPAPDAKPDQSQPQ